MNNQSIRETVDLEFGVEINGVIHRTATLRPAILADTYCAAELIKIPADIDSKKSSMISYQMAIDDALVLGQIEQIGTATQVPSIQELIDTIDPDDMGILRAAAERLKKKLRQSRIGLPPIDDLNSSSSAQGSA